MSNANGLTLSTAYRKAILVDDCLSLFQVLTGTELQSQGVPAAVPASFKNFSISQKEKTIDELVKDRWLSSTSDGTIRLGVRSFLDLRSWFRNNDVPSCVVCNEAGIKVFFLMLFRVD